MNEQDTLHPATVLPVNFRDDDPLSTALRGSALVGIEDLVNLNRYQSPPTVASSSAAATTTVFSSRKESTATKPTSFGTSYPVEGHNGKGIATYESSLSATHGSGSETELEAIRDNSLIGVGDWTGDGARPLKGHARSLKRPRATRRLRVKKPVVILQQERTGSVSSAEDERPTMRHVTRRDGRGAKYLRHRRNIPEHDQLELAEEGRLSEESTLSPPAPKPLSRTRFWTMISLIVAIILTFALSAFAVHYTGKARMRCTKGIIFMGTVLISLFTVLVMLTAKKTLQEALLAGLLGLIVGFALDSHIHEFM